MQGSSNVRVGSVIFGVRDYNSKQSKDQSNDSSSSRDSIGQSNAAHGDTTVSGGHTKSSDASLSVTSDQNSAFSSDEADITNKMQSVSC